MKIKTYLNWSSGKDSAMALWDLQNDQRYSVEFLLTTIAVPLNRVSMHGVRRGLLEEQLRKTGLPFRIIELPHDAGMEEYNRIMHQTVKNLKNDGFSCAAFGDILLEDLRQYREKQLEKLDMKTVFPLWGRDTGELAREFLQKKFQAIVVSVNGQLMDQSFAGMLLDKGFFDKIPVNVDACGENGEYHTFCFDGPVFREPVPFVTGEKLYHEYDAPKANKSDAPAKIGFWFCDLLPIKKENQ